MDRKQYSPEILAQASLDIASDPEIGNPHLARRVEQEIADGGDAFYLVFRALGNGQVIMEQAERRRLEQVSNGKINKPGKTRHRGDN